jgi:hypothetical protein
VRGFAAIRAPPNVTAGGARQAPGHVEKRALVERFDVERELPRRPLDHVVPSESGQTHLSDPMFFLHDFLHECRQYPQWQARVGQQNLRPTGAFASEQDRHESRTQLAVYQLGQLERWAVVPHSVVVGHGLKPPTAVRKRDRHRQIFARGALAPSPHAM